MWPPWCCYSKEGPTPTSEDSLTPILLASGEGFIEALLANPGINVSPATQRNITALHRASIFGHFEVVEALLMRSDVDVNKKDTVDENTPPHLALYKG